jgi:hypothetical protein
MRIAAGILMVVVAIVNFSTGCIDSYSGFQAGMDGNRGIDTAEKMEEGEDADSSDAEELRKIAEKLKEESKTEGIAKSGNQIGFGLFKLVLGGLEIIASIMLLAGAGAFFIRLTAGLEIASVAIAITVMGSESYVLFGLSALAVLLALISAQGFRAMKTDHRGSGEVPLISERGKEPAVPETINE